jgi:hypothetical protein
VATLQKVDGNLEFDPAYCSGNPPYYDELLFGPIKKADGLARIGTFADFDSGSGQFPCPWSFKRIERGLVLFDVASLGAAAAGHIVSATLHFDSTIKYSLDPADNCPYDLLGSISVLNEPWSLKFDLNADFLTDFAPAYSCVASDHTVDLSAVVRDWISGARPNHGLFFISRKESFVLYEKGEYTQTLNKVKLTVQVSIPAVP